MKPIIAISVTFLALTCLASAAESRDAAPAPSESISTNLPTYERQYTVNGSYAIRSVTPAVPRESDGASAGLSVRDVYCLEALRAVLAREALPTDPLARRVMLINAARLGDEFYDVIHPLRGIGAEALGREFLSKAKEDRDIALLPVRAEEIRKQIDEANRRLKANSDLKNPDLPTEASAPVDR